MQHLCKEYKRVELKKCILVFYGIDYLSSQPDFILELIISLLSFTQKLNLSCVSKKFKKLVFKNLNNNLSWTPLEKGFELLPHQEKIILWMRHRAYTPYYGIRGGLLALEMGLGKTLTCLAYCCIFRSKVPNLVICGKTQLNVWSSEIKKFYGNRVKFLLFHPEYMGRKAFDYINYENLMSYDIIITTYDVCKSVCLKNNYHSRVLRKDRFGRIIEVVHTPIVRENKKACSSKLLYSIKWNRIFTDESHKFRNPKSKLFFSMMALDARERWCLSGTPIVNSEYDLCTLFRFCGNNYLNSSSLNEFMNKCAYRLTMKEANIQLPQLHIQYITHPLNTIEEKDIYDLYLDHMRVKWQELGNKNIALYTMLMRMRQICVAPHLITKNAHKEKCQIINLIRKKYPERADWLFDVKQTSGIQSSRIQKIIEVIRTFNNEKILLFSIFSSALKVIKKAINIYIPQLKVEIISGGVKNREAIIDRYLSGEIDVLLMTYQVGSEGHTFVHVNKILLVDWWWNSVIMQQAIARCHRPGQKRNVDVYIFEVANSIETRMRGVCDNKMDTTKQYLSSIKQTFNQNDMQRILN